MLLQLDLPFFGGKPMSHWKEENVYIVYSFIQMIQMSSSIHQAAVELSCLVHHLRQTVHGVCVALHARLVCIT
jgi:hypothetical protein